MGRDPAAVGVGDHRARRARPRLRGPTRSRRAVEGWQRLHGRGRRAPAPRGVPVAGLGHRRSPCSALRACGVPADHPQLVRGRRVPPRARRCTVKGDWAIRVPDLAPGGWAFEYENDLYPDVDDAAVICARAPAARHRRRRGRARARLARRHAVARRRLGRVRRRQRGDVALQDPVLRLRQGDRRAERRRHRARARDARARATATTTPVERGLELAARRAGGRRLVVRPLGRQPPLRHGRRAARRSRRAASRTTIPRCAAPSPGSTRSSRRAAASARTSAPTPTPRGAAARRSRRRRRRRGRCSPTWPQETLRMWPRAGRQTIFARPALGRRLGRGALHRHRIPARFHDPLPPLPHQLSRCSHSDD